VTTFLLVTADDLSFPSPRAIGRQFGRSRRRRLRPFSFLVAERNSDGWRSVSVGISVSAGNFIMSSRKRASKAAEIARIEGLIGDLEQRLHRLNNSAHNEATGASNDINQFVAQTLEGVMERMHDRVNTATEQVADRASKASMDAYKRVADEMEHYPLATLAVAAGIGFLLGAARR
jgi:ElaB/YqjD/DUF883 family membrane-anchored ribosome-binding protein